MIEPTAMLIGDGDRHEAQDGRREIARAAADDREQDHPDDQRDQVGDLDRSDAGGAGIRANLQPAQVHPVLLDPHRDKCRGAAPPSVPRPGDPPPAVRDLRPAVHERRHIRAHRHIEVQRPAGEAPPVRDSHPGRQLTARLDVDIQRHGRDQSPVQRGRDGQRIVDERPVEPVIRLVELHEEAQRVGHEADDRVPATGVG